MPHAPPDPVTLKSALTSPLRLRLLAELMEAEGQAMPLERLIVLCRRHAQDVLACLRPMVTWGLVAIAGEPEVVRIPDQAPADLLDIVAAVVDDRAAQIAHEREVQQNLLTDMVGVSPKMLVIFELIRQVARIDVPVLILGETGTGKELVARAVHALSGRRGGPFSDVNCATLSDDLFPSEVFGHVRGAFTGAHRDHDGLLAQSDGGSLLLDEVGELSLGNQARFLRVLQVGTFRRLGEARSRSSDFRLIAATHRDLPAMVQEGTFRRDLYYRLNVFPIRLPSLRERPEDLPYLVEHLLSRHGRDYDFGGPPARLTPRALERLRDHRWPGNVRELENVLLRARVVATGAAIDLQHLPPLSAPGDPSPRPADRLHRTLEEVEAEHIQRVLEDQGGNVTSSARILGLSRTTLYAKIDRYGLER